MTGAWLPPKPKRRPPPVPPVGEIEPGVAFVAQPGHRFDVVDRISGELLGTIWRARDHTWSAADTDGFCIFADLRGTRQDVGLWLQRRRAESANQNGILDSSDFKQTDLHDRIR